MLCGGWVQVPSMNVAAVTIAPIGQQ